MEISMKKYILATLLAVTTIGFSSCDDGRIYPETAKLSEGKTVQMEGVLTGLSGWPGAYRVAIAGFENIKGHNQQRCYRRQSICRTIGYQG